MMREDGLRKTQWFIHSKHRALSAELLYNSQTQLVGRRPPEGSGII
jgi:hypothetical protein